MDEQKERETRLMLADGLERRLITPRTSKIVIGRMMAQEIIRILRGEEGTCQENLHRTIASLPGDCGSRCMRVE